MQALSPFSAVLRVPVLYGPTDDVSESAVTVLANDVIKGKPKKVLDFITPISFLLFELYIYIIVSTKNSLLIIAHSLLMKTCVFPRK